MSSTHTLEEGILDRVIFAEMVLESEGESDEASVTVGEPQQCGTEVVLQVGRVGGSQGRKPLLFELCQLIVCLGRQFLEINFL